MRTLLINPWIHDFSAYNLWIQPLGLLYLAGVLLDHGFDVDYIDCLGEYAERKPDGRAKFAKQLIPKPAPLQNVRRQYGRYGISIEKFRSLLQTKERPDAILVTSGMTYWYPGVQETIGELRIAFPAVSIYLGGIYATLMPDHAKAFSGADVVISGQFENGVVSLLSGHRSQSYSSLNDYPYPAWQLTEENTYRVLLTSRGCPYRCTFCASDILFEQKFAQRKAESILTEITHHIKEGIREFVFYDDALLINHKRHLEPLLRELIKREIKAHFHTPNGLNAREIDCNLASLMFGAGFRTIRLSLESADPLIQKEKGNNKVNNSLFETAVGNLFDSGYKPGEIECYLLIGLPGQSPENVRTTLNFVRDLGVIARLATFSPIPGTPEAALALSIIGDDFIREPLLQNHSCFPLKDDSMTEQELQGLKLECEANNASIRLQ